MSQREPSEEEVRAALEEQMRRISVEDVLVQTAVTLVNLAGRRLGLVPEAAGERDLEQARVAIEATRALLPLIPADTAGPIRDALSQLQMAFARESQAVGEPPPGAGPPAEGAAGAEAPPPGQGAPADRRRSAAEEAERAKARSRIWTPPGS